MKSILVVDDTSPLLEEIRDLLQMEDYVVTTASNGFDGLNKLKLMDTDLIITDIVMPEMDGFTFISNLRAIPKYKDTPVLVLSAQATKEFRERVKASSADGFLTKPCSADELLLLIENLLKYNGPYSSITCR